MATAFQFTNLMQNGINEEYEKIRILEEKRTFTCAFELAQEGHTKNPTHNLRG